MMQIIMNQAEIEAAITNYVTKKIQVSEDQEIKVELQATRGVNGYTATLDINTRLLDSGAEAPEPVKAVEPKATPKPTLGIKPKPKAAEPEPEYEPVADPEPENQDEDETTSTEVKQAYTGEDDGADDEVENTMATSSRDEEPPMNETAAPPRSIFSKKKTA
jgi:hypothetical protein